MPPTGSTSPLKVISPVIATSSLIVWFFNADTIAVAIVTPADGPSAGVTIATAIVSAIRNQRVRPDVAMTGEITLSGLVLPVGGIREKALAARRHGIKTFILPARNESDLDELPPEVRKSVHFVPVKTLEEVLKIALPPDVE